VEVESRNELCRSEQIEEKGLGFRVVGCGLWVAGKEFTV
jgi:hypothetical protein